MAGPWLNERFPQFRDAITRLAEQHRELEDEPLHLALSYGPDRDPHDIFLFEVIGGSEDDVSPDKALFETTFEPNARLQSGFDRRLHLILTTPHEVRIALEDGWPSAEEVVNAVRKNDYQVLFSDEEGDRMMDLIREATARRQEAARGGV